MTGMGDAFGAQIRAAKAEGELAAIMDALRGFAEENGLNPEMEPRDLLAKAAGAFRSCSAMSDARYAEIQGLRAEMEAMRPRLMPDGCEWPTVDGKPVDFVTGYEPSLGVLEAVSIYSNGACEVMGHDGIIKDVKEIHVATPKVLDADGMEIRKGDTVYQMGCKYRVSHLHGANDYVRIVYKNSGRWVDPKTLTHRAPVLAADGRPLREGETVWSVDSGTRYTVEKVTDELIPIKCCSEMGSTVSLHPSQLTHERPVADTWERLEEDATMLPGDYCDLRGVVRKDTTIASSVEGMARDLVRRAKKLAEVE